MKIKTIDMEIALARFFNPRVNLIVPCVSWGLYIHECDMLVLTKTGYATEVEIKVSLADLKKDRDKRHKHESEKIKYLYFALPDYLDMYSEYVPEKAGIILVDSTDTRCMVLREPKLLNPYKFTDEDRYQLARLGAMRIWGLKRKIASFDIKKPDTAIKALEIGANL